MSEIYYKGRSFSQAKRCWLKVLDERPDDGSANLGMGCLYWREMDFARAVDSWRKAVDTDPTNTRAKELLRRASEENEIFGIRRPVTV